MEAPLALYRRHRPETFSEVIGQDHVTGPLRAALANNRVNHAYLFSGPRGCGKTTSARILARALNCEEGPGPDPCGRCQSCRDLARGGPGSIDVIEIDAASHGGVDDARDLRERAFFAPVASRYKVYIIDEAHMVTTQGFNALLKLVEEPPEHLKFIFATTEPDKVIGTIRSRTHHYPFRLIPPRVLSAYLSQICESEGVRIEPAALPLVVRAGGGSARDTLSVLDQLIGGAGPDGVTHELAAGLLGYTPESLLDDVVDAFAAVDGASVFSSVDRVVETGQDPRRFTEDLLRRLRDLVIIAAVPDAPATGLIDAPEDQAERLVAQAARFGRAELSRAADLVAAGLTELKGATAPRLLLELLCARVLLPGADDTDDGVMARLDRLERRVAIEGGSPAAARSAPATAPAPATGRARPSPPADATEVPPRPQTTERPEPAADAADAADAASPTPPEASPAPPDSSGTPAGGDDPASEAPVSPAAPPAAARVAAPADIPPAPSAAAESGAPLASAGSALGLTDVRRLWPELLERVKLKRRFTWILLSQNAQVAAVDDTTLTVALLNAGARDSFASSSSAEILRQAAIDVVGVDWRVEAIVDPTARPGADPSSAPRVVRPAVTADEAGAADAAGSPSSPAAEERAVDPATVSRAREAIQGGREPGAREDTGSDSHHTQGRAQDGQRDTGPDTGRDPGHGGGQEGRRGAPPANDDEGADPDDPDADDQDVGGADLLERELGASLIEEIRHQ